MKKVFPAWLVLTLAMAACSMPLEADTETAAAPLASPSAESRAGSDMPAGVPQAASPSLQYMDFVDREHGWGITFPEAGTYGDAIPNSGRIVRSDDGGSTWFDVTPPGMDRAHPPRTLTLLDRYTVWALVPGADTSTGVLYHTVDGGATWSSSEVPFGGADLQFLDDTTGRAMADRGAGAGSNAIEVFHSSDGGATWTSVYHNDPSRSGAASSLPLSGIKNGMTFLDGQTGWVTGSIPMEGEIYIYVTHDGGVTWAHEEVPIPAEFNICQFNPRAPVFFGSRGLLPVIINFPDGNTAMVFYVSEDGGETWSGDPSDARQVVQAGAFSFADALTGFVWNGGENFYFTTAGAGQWTGMAASLDLSDSLFSIDFVDSTHGWALTGPFDSGRSWLFGTQDGGVTWTQLSP